MNKELRSNVKLSSIVANELRQKILQEKLEPGDRFLTEKEVVEQWSCSRATAREALLLLEYEGLIVSKPGPKGGVFIREPDGTPFIRLFSTIIELKNITRDELLEARIELEASCAYHAAKNATPEDLEYIYEAMEKFEKTVKLREESIPLNITFHLAIAAASHNQVLHFLMKILETIMYEHQTNTKYTRKQIEDVMKAHREIYNAIAAGNPTAAANAMRNHLDPFYRDYKSHSNKH